MASTATYLNFSRETEQAFDYYKSVFGTEYFGPIARMGDVPSQDGQSGTPSEDANLVMNVALPITGGHVLMGTDAPDSMGFKLNQGNNVYICIMPDSKVEADKLFDGLSDGGKIESAMSDQFWGDYWGSCTDKFGVQWMVNVVANR